MFFPTQEIIPEMHRNLASYLRVVIVALDMLALWRIPYKRESAENEQLNRPTNHVKAILFDILYLI